ncbi:hypothetical protein [Mycoplasma sp. 1654_15]|uniref:hypothetical protein n=1 Tax=Mycoplasma sp. 1654_15 TaxID=2725994 RepID=UPI001449B7C1|nr:hypothetical protein [Mycoplasma sp. 1654_15]QJB71558.1 hypothetical protein HF996_03880 [Mycoplasma sp. 1654_15]
MKIKKISKKLLFSSISTIALFSTVLVSCGNENEEKPTQIDDKDKASNNQSETSNNPSKSTNTAAEQNLTKELQEVHNKFIAEKVKPFIENNSDTITKLLTNLLSNQIQVKLNIQSNTSENEGNLFTNPNFSPLITQSLTLMNDYESSLQNTKTKAELVHIDLKKLIKQESIEKFNRVLAKLKSNEFEKADLPENLDNIKTDQDFENIVNKNINKLLAELLEEKQASIKEQLDKLSKEELSVQSSNILITFLPELLKLQTKINKLGDFTSNYIKKLHPNPTKTDIDNFSNSTLKKIIDDTITKYKTLLEA